MTAPPKTTPRLPIVLLGLMTAFSFGGPLAIGYILRGGANPNWPPDRAVEWATFAAVSGMVFVLMMACLSLALVNRKAMPSRSPDAAEPSPSPLPGGEGGKRGLDRTGVEP